MRQGFKTFYPHVSEWVGLNMGNRSRLVRKPYFVGYLFIQTLVECFYQINKSIGVTGLVCSTGNEPYHIHNDFMQALFDLADPLGEILKPNPRRDEYGGSVGDSVRFSEGHPLWGLTAEILRVVDNEKIVVRLREMLGAERDITVAPSDGQLVKASNKGAR